MDLMGSRPQDARTCPECGSDLLDGDVCELCLADLGEYPGRAAADLPPAAAGVGDGHRDVGSLP